ncbi:hypothetical protein Y032_0092g2535 [Ancylostoma ceylanicum]|uniref:Uncharacterized protein n=1 Tax=Ancylostoma ceylanicum TaxID=53326 RepID=A0A016TLW9_9BILA|nr:hypothetical protein Y032_0092g2535 [Ancylostoma ceylanicum]
MQLASESPMSQPNHRGVLASVDASGSPTALAASSTRIHCRSIEPVPRLNKLSEIIEEMTPVSPPCT